MRNVRHARIFAILICLALLVWCTAIARTGAHIDLTLPVLVFCFFAVIPLSLLPADDHSPAVQPIALLAVRISRAPPVA